MRRKSILLLVAIVIGMIGAAVPASASPPDPNAVDYTTLSSIQLNGVSATQLTVVPGADVKIGALWHDVGDPCSGCEIYLAVGWAGQTQAGCIENNGRSTGQSGSGLVDLGAAPTTPGTYNIVAHREQVFFCGQFWNAGASSGYQVVAQVVVAKVPQSITFNPIPTHAVTSAPFGVTASASSGLPVSFTSDTTGVCSVSGSTVTIGSGGICTIRASQAGNVTFLPAPDMVQSFLVYAGGPLGACKGPALTAPTSPSSAPGNASAAVSWFPSQQVPPGGCVAGYVVTPSLNGTPQTPILIPGGATTTVLHGLTNAGEYSFTIASEDGTAIGPASVATAKITVGAPTAATAVHAVRVAKGAVRVAFHPARDNGAAITDYTASCRTGEAWIARSKAATSSPITITGLRPGMTYTCTVAATNSRGIGPGVRTSGVKA